MQTTETLSVENKEFYDKTLIKRMVPTLLFANYGQKKSLKKNSGKTIAFRKFDSLSPATTPLNEGVTPLGTELNVTEISATINQYGDYVEISDVLDMVGIDPILTETAEILGEQAGLTIDNIVKETICLGTNVRYVGSQNTCAVSTATVSGVMTAKEIQKAVRTLKNDNARPFDGKYYIGIIDPDISYDLQQDPLFLDVSKYNGGTQIIDGEIGKLGKVRFIETTNTKTIQREDGNVVHCAMIIGKDAYGIVDIEGSSRPEMIVKPHGSSGTADPLNQRATSGWKAFFTARRLNELAMIRIECLTSTEMETTSSTSSGSGASAETPQTSVDTSTVTCSTSAVTVSNVEVASCGSVQLINTTFYVTGTINSCPEGLTLSEGMTHCFGLKIQKPNTNYQTARYVLDTALGEFGTADGFVMNIELNSSLTNKTLAIYWDGVTATNYTIDVSGVTLA